MPRARVAVAVLAVAALAVAALLATMGRHARRGPASVPSNDIDLSPAAAYDTAVGLVRQERFRVSLPYFRHAVRALPQDWRAHFGLAAALSNVTLQFTTRGGVMVPETRSSADRVALMGEAFEEFERAARTAPDGPTRALVLATWANQLYRYGFVWEAFAAYRHSAEADPSNPAYARNGDALMAILRDPCGAAEAPVGDRDPARGAAGPDGP